MTVTPPILYTLPDAVLKTIARLESLIVVPPQEETTTATNTSFTTGPHGGPRSVSNSRHHHPVVVPIGGKRPHPHGGSGGNGGGQGRHHGRETNPSSSSSRATEEWMHQRLSRTGGTPTETFKPTAMPPPATGGDQEINAIRIALNKLTVKNYEAQKHHLLEKVGAVLQHTGEAAETHKTKIAHFIFDIVSANKFYSEVYANLYQELIPLSSLFSTMLHEYLATFKESVGHLQYRDPNTDYDGYCAYVKENDKRRAMASFFVHMANRTALTGEVLVDLIQHFQTTFLKYMDQENRVQECEELAELLFIVLSLCQSNVAVVATEAWRAQIVPAVETIANKSSKNKEHPSLSSRAIFKHLDLWGVLKSGAKR